MKHALALAVCSILIALGIAPAVAQPSYAQPSGNRPPPSYAVRTDTIHGRIVSFDGRYALTVRDDRGYVDRVTLHDGTVINPRGLRLEPGMSVTIIGEPGSSSLRAYEIDTRYHEDPGYQAYPYYYDYRAPGYQYYETYPDYETYPAYYPYACCYGPFYGFGIGIRFGGYGHHR